MVTRPERRAEYSVRGHVVDRPTGRGVRGIRVEAWDRDTRFHDLLGQAVTDEDGAFTIAFDAVFFGDHAPDRAPDVYFKLFLDQREVLSTFDRPLRNADRGDIDVRLEIDMPQVQPEGVDRVSAEQAIKMADWWRASDFRGVARETRDKATTVGKLIGALAGRSLANFDFDPVRPTGTREKEVVSQDVANARRSLALRQVEVMEVKSLQAEGARAGLRSLKDYPLRLAAGDRVVLYEDDGIVTHYARVPPPDAGRADAEAVVRIDGDVQSLKAQMGGVDTLRRELDNLKAADRATEERISADAEGLRAHSEEIDRLRHELVSVRRASDEKDAQIASLKTDLANVRAAQDSLASRIPLSRIEALEREIGRLRPRGSAEPAPVKPSGRRKRKDE